MLDWKKKKAIFHINMLKKWHKRPEEQGTTLYVKEQDNEKEDKLFSVIKDNPLYLVGVCQNKSRNDC